MKKQTKVDEDIFGVFDEPAKSNKSGNNSSTMFGQDLSSLYNNPLPAQNNDIFSQNQQMFESQPAFGLAKPPQKPPTTQSSGFDFPASGQNVGIDIFANLAASSQAPTYQSLGAGQQQPSSTNNLESIFNQMSLQQNQFQAQSTGNFAGGQNSYGSSGQFQGTSGFGQTTGGFGQSTGGFGQSTGGFGAGTAQFGQTSFSPPSSDIFGGSNSSSHFATQGSMTSQSSTAGSKASTDDFGAFQSSEKDAWSMGKGLGKLDVHNFYS